jgi:signal transduction histidine kinase
LELKVRKSFYVTFALIGVVLGFLLLLAFNQFKLYGQHEKIISQTEEFIFQYSIIREQIIEDVVTGRLDELSEISTSVEALHTSIIKILDNSLIPPEYKFSFLQQIDLPGLVLLLRRASAEQENQKILQIINQETRVIGERFILFERLVLGYAKQKLVDFQMVIIGTLALVVFLVIILMVIMYRLLIMPVISLTKQSEYVQQGQQDKIYIPHGWREISILSEKMSELLEESEGRSNKIERNARMMNCFQHVLQKIHEHHNRDKLYKSVCRALLVNEDYLLAWIGVEDPDEKGIMPVAADGSSTMSCEECNECFGALLAEQEGTKDPTVQALQGGETVMHNDILAYAPKGPFKNTPLADGVVDSISIPIIFRGHTFGVLTVYVMVEGGVLEEEAGLLTRMAEILAEKLHYIDLRDKLDMEKTARNIIGEQSNIITFTLDGTGRILSVDSFLTASIYRDASKQWRGMNIGDIVLPENDSERIILNRSLVEGIRYDFNAKLVGFDVEFSAILEPGDDFPAEDAIFLLVLMPPQKNMLIQPENFQVAYSAAIGQFAGSIAHEITDLSNGVINYAQMLSDDIVGEEGAERKGSLEKIIVEGEKMASMVEPLLIDQDDFECARSIENVHSIFNDTLLLVGPRFKKDCITVNLDIQSASIQYRKQHLQLMLLILLTRLRESLNERYPQKDPDKVLDITVSQYREEAKNILMIAIAFTGKELDYDPAEIQKGQMAGMWLSQELARNLGGEMKFGVTSNEKIKVELLLPV